ncbi:MAG: ABC transporter ATP-binding protein [Pseudomonadota bacterium]|nr:ABC transporter ATP-binding protein [Pseudomonadota bacterium]
MNQEILQIESLTKAFGGLTVLQDVSLSLSAGERFGLIGPNGAGKTTVFNLLSGVYSVDSGTVHLGGEDITNLPVKSRIGLGLSRSFQNIRLMPHLSVIENVMVGQHSEANSIMNLVEPINWIKNNNWRQRAIHTLEETGLEIDPDINVSELPYGVRKKLEVVRGLMSNPKVLMLDEPAAGLNPGETQELAEFLREISRTGVTLLLVEHDMNFIHALCQRVAVLNFGSKIFEGTPAEVTQDSAVLEAYLGTSEVGKSAS